MAHKTLTGKVTSVKMTNSIVVEVTRTTPHPIYKKRILKSKSFVVDPAGQSVKEGDVVRIVETRQMSKNKYFKVEKVVKEGAAK